MNGSHSMGSVAQNGLPSDRGRIGARVAGVVHEDVDGPERRRTPIDHPANRVEVGHVGLDAECAAARRVDLVRDGCCAVGDEVVHDDLRAVRGHVARGLRADALARARHEGGVPGQVEEVERPCFRHFVHGLSSRERGARS